MDGAHDPNFDLHGFAQRAREAMFPEKITAFAQRIGLPQATVSKLMSGGSVAGPRIDIVARVASGLGVSIDWLVSGTGDGPQGDEVVRIPRYDVQLAAGAGAWNEGRQAVEDIPLTVRFLEQQFGRRSASGLAFVTARGDSMEPTITDRGLVLIDQNVTELFDDVFAFVLAGEARVKRFRVLTDGVTLMSDNADYPSETISGAEMKRLQIIGQVLGVMQRI
ncbi:XRE family transcriptional regulator [Phenylobacterium sp. 58.2.17]|uniref:XRE family transcriptional regulator n=1 Tax=Phenylobacterium sp. 58.2.17 TaxID=2969306 RepID=UPI0022640B83|nr:S24 family peptidase [Phenylobacterium sp. 58.2.17]MCX7586577.1 helix-turn-helix domain-containing protein [Phenylobacterium sp. 58.2.17]